MTTPIAGDWVTIAANGNDITGQLDQQSYTHQHTGLALSPDNTGLKYMTPGIFQPQLTLGGFVQHTQTGISAFNLFSPTAPGAAVDTEFIISGALGANAAPVAGNCGFIFDGKLLPEFGRPDDVNSLMRFSAQFRPFGVRVPLFPRLLVDRTTPATGSFTSTPLDDGAESVGSLAGAVSCLQVLTPTGTAASGNVAGTQPANNDTLVLNGITFTAKTTLTGAANEILIGANFVATQQNLFSALMGDPIGRGTVYGVGTSNVNPASPYYSATLAAALFSVPNVSTGQINITYGVTGTGGNAYTLVRTGIAWTVSAATLTGGVNGETATSIVVQTATTSGGAYTTKATHTLDMTRRAAEIIQVGVGTTIDEFEKVIITMSGSTMPWAARLMFGRWYQNQR